MKTNSKIVILVSTLLIILSISISYINFSISLKNTEKQLKTQSLPLSLDNIYTDIQKHILEPYLVSSMMASDTFVNDWLLNDEVDSKKITKYLDRVRNKYHMFLTFLVSEKSKKYYTNSGLLETINKDNKDNKWYFDFKDSQNEHEINLDFNSNIGNELFMFINYKLFDRDYHMMGVTGIGLKISYIQDMLNKFKNKYKLNVFFVSSNGNIVLNVNKNLINKKITDVEEFKGDINNIIRKDTIVNEYTKNGNKYLLTTKYIEELNLYLVVEAKTDDFVESVYKTFIANLVISLLMTLFITVIILKTFKKYQSNLENLAQQDNLTGILNRRSFSEKLTDYLKIYHRNGGSISLLFLDIDDFKAINDTLGHEMGDKILKRFAEILKESIRDTDLVARWGGEEFLIAYIDTDLVQAEKVANNLCAMIEKDMKIFSLLGQHITASIGLVQLQDSDNIETLISRADMAMYEAKESGKNKVVVK